jgi:hypothetical protein
VVAKWNSIKSLQKIWQWAKEVLTHQEFKNQLLLAKDSLAETALNVLADKYKSFSTLNIL